MPSDETVIQSTLILVYLVVQKKVCRNNKQITFVQYVGDYFLYLYYYAKNMP